MTTTTSILVLSWTFFLYLFVAHKTKREPILAVMIHAAACRKWLSIVAIHVWQLRGRYEECVREVVREL